MELPMSEGLATQRYGLGAFADESGIDGAGVSGDPTDAGVLIELLVQVAPIFRISGLGI